jgi:hypothetical protein
MTTKYVDNGAGAKLNQTANQYTLATVLATTTPVKASSGTVFGFSTSAKFNAAISLINSMRLALLAAGIGK